VPPDGSSLSFPQNRVDFGGVVFAFGAWTYAPSGQEAIQVGGQPIEAVVYEGQQELIDDNTPSQGSLKKVRARLAGYYDQGSGILVRREYTETLIECMGCEETGWSNYVGQVKRHLVFDLANGAFATNEAVTTPSVEATAIAAVTPETVDTVPPADAVIVNGVVIPPDFYARYEMIENLSASYTCDRSTPARWYFTGDYGDFYLPAYTSEQVRLVGLDSDGTVRFSRTDADGQTTALKLSAKDLLEDGWPSYWMPLDGRTFTRPGYSFEDREVAAPTVYAPARTDVIEIAGRRVAVQVYEMNTKVQFKKMNGACPDRLGDDAALETSQRSTGYFDTFTGLRLRTEYVETAVACTNCDADRVIGQDFIRMVKELTGTNQPLAVR
jgi:hypothetical protein